MIDLTNVTHHAAIEEIVEVICNKTQNTDRGFFRAEVAYFLGKMAASMRAIVVTKDRGEIPVNIYALCLASSGYGKGHSVNLVENEFMKPFKKRFMEEALPIIAEQHLIQLAKERAERSGSNMEDELTKLEGEFRRAGAFPFTFDSGTPPAVKQLRQKLLLANIGSINLQIDEIGSNLISSTDILTLFLELYDQGMVKQKLTKNTVDNQRSEEVDGKTPTNALLFGTQAKLFDGGQTEDQFYSMLDIGYARRCIFGWGQQDQKAFHTQNAREIYLRLTQPTNNVTSNKWSEIFYDLADPANYGAKINVEEDVGIRLLEYKIACEIEATKLPDHDEIRKAEMSHRYFKALKLAGAYAFVDGTKEITMDQLMSAILLIEESGIAFQKILSREKTYVKLAKYVATVGTEVTHADLHEALPFYKSGQAARNEMMTLATAWGYPRHILIKKSFVDGIEFFKGETLKENNTDESIISYSDHYAFGYLNERVPFDKLHTLTEAKGMHWCNHHFRDGHRLDEKTMAGFNLIVIDVDGDVNLDTAHDLMKDYRFLTYTTKRHTDEANRFRLIMPTNYELHLDSDEYKEFMNSLMEWLPFKTDEAANQRCKKWETFPGSYHYNLEGELLDVLPFIPKTSKHELHKQSMQKIQSMDNLERWFAQRIASGNRNNQMIKYALALVDSGLNLVNVNDQVHAFNKKLANPMDESEINATIMATVAKKFQRA